MLKITPSQIFDRVITNQTETKQSARSGFLYSINIFKTIFVFGIFLTRKS